MTTEERFWEKVKITDDNSCWEWQGFRYPTGHGQFWINGRDVKASRAFWLIYNGPLRTDQYVLHDCDNPACVNPSHLYIGTHSENIRDMVDRKRRKYDRSCKAKLDWDQVREIRKWNSVLPHYLLAEIHGVSITTIGRIVNNRDGQWRLEDDPARAS